MTLSAKVSAMIQATQTTSVDLQTASSELSQRATIAFTDGGGAGQASKLWSDRRTVSTSEDLDLAGGLTDIYGNSITFAGIKALFIKAAAANADNVVVGGGDSPNLSLAGWTGTKDDTIRIQPGGAFLLMSPTAAGYAVTGATADLLRVASSSVTSPPASVTYEIVVIGD